jgi:radical SAM superfamily enzyme YgiQ (UPF0313 family)
MYKGVPYHTLSMGKIESTIADAQQSHPQAMRVFLADGDVMALGFDQLKNVLQILNERIPRLSRINTYANGLSVLGKSEEQLRELRSLKLNTLYMGLESGHNGILKTMKKRETAEEMIEAGQRAQTAGLKMSVMILTGLGGQARSTTHAAATATALNQMQPRLLSALRVIPIPGTPLHAAEQNGNFQQLTEHQAIEELQEMIQGMELESTVFRANHSSNILPLEGRLPKDKSRLLDNLNTLLASGRLDAESPGPPPLSL